MQVLQPLEFTSNPPINEQTLDKRKQNFYIDYLTLSNINTKKIIFSVGQKPQIVHSMRVRTDLGHHLFLSQTVQFRLIFFTCNIKMNECTASQTLQRYVSLRLSSLFLETFFRCQRKNQFQFIRRLLMVINIHVHFFLDRKPN